MESAIDTRQADIVEFILDNVPTNEGDLSAGLANAVLNGDYRITQMLLEAGAEPDEEMVRRDFVVTDTSILNLLATYKIL